MRCEDCGQPVLGTDEELKAIRAGITICEECIASMEGEAEAYGEITVGYHCAFCRAVDRVLTAAPATGEE